MRAGQEAKELEVQLRAVWTSNTLDATGMQRAGKWCREELAEEKSAGAQAGADEGKSRCAGR